MDIDKRKEYRDYAWSYFSSHADQRLKIFNFYIAFSTVIIGGFVTLIKDGGVQIEYWIFPLMLTFFSFVFWKFEERARMLIKNAEAALKYLDDCGLNDEEKEYLALFNLDQAKADELNKFPIFTGYFSYSRVFRWVYGFFTLTGIIGFFACIV
ncbi:MAG: hypothetical protein JKX76_15375 [Colwellia sp.]|nr:hypothetical protein [Colwellia sp.]